MRITARSWRVRVYQVLLDREILVAEIHLALLSLALGARTVSTPIALGAPSYRYLLQAAPAIAWGLMMFLAGSLQLYGVIRHWQRLRVIGMFVQTCYWTAITILIAAANPVGWGPLIFGILAFTAFWAYLRLTIRTESP